MKTSGHRHAAGSHTDGPAIKTAQDWVSFSGL